MRKVSRDRTCCTVLRHRELSEERAPGLAAPFLPSLLVDTPNESQTMNTSSAMPPTIAKGKIVASGGHRRVSAPRPSSASGTASQDGKKVDL